jgi:hypothetical protein
MTTPRKKPVARMTLAQIMAVVMQHAHECGDCLVWDGAVSATRNSGLVGSPKFRGRSLRRLLLEKQTGKPLPPGKLATATCETPLCIAHLGTTDKSGAAVKGYDNAGVRLRKAVANKRTAHALPWVKLSHDKADYIRASDASCRQLAAELGVDKTLIGKVRQGKAWAPSKAANPFAGLMA